MPRSQVWHPPCGPVLRPPVTARPRPGIMSREIPALDLRRERSMPPEENPRKALEKEYSPSFFGDFETVDLTGGDTAGGSATRSGRPSKRAPLRDLIKPKMAARTATPTPLKTHSLFCLSQSSIWRIRSCVRASLFAERRSGPSQYLGDCGSPTNCGRFPRKYLSGGEFWNPHPPFSPDDFLR